MWYETLNTTQLQNVYSKIWLAHLQGVAQHCLVRSPCHCGRSTDTCHGPTWTPHSHEALAETGDVPGIRWAPPHQMWRVLAQRYAATKWTQSGTPSQSS